MQVTWIKSPENNQPVTEALEIHFNDSRKKITLQILTVLLKSC